MKNVEFEIYVPLFDNEGKPTSRKLLRDFRETLIKKFGGLTDTRHRNKGIWKVGPVKYYDQIVIWRVIAAKSPRPDPFIKSLKKDMETKLKQEQILIIRREIEVIGS